MNQARNLDDIRCMCMHISVSWDNQTVNEVEIIVWTRGLFVAIYSYLHLVDSLPFPVVATWLFTLSLLILTVTDLGSARLVRKEWQSSGRGVA